MFNTKAHGAWYFQDGHPSVLIRDGHGLRHQWTSTGGLWGHTAHFSRGEGGGWWTVRKDGWMLNKPMDERCSHVQYWNRYILNIRTYRLLAITILHFIRLQCRTVFCNKLRIHLHCKCCLSIWLLHHQTQLISRDATIVFTCVQSYYGYYGVISCCISPHHLSWQAARNGGATES